jgi:histidyl-tRNA synthetase
MSQVIQSLPGFRDFFPLECAVRNYLFQAWRGVSARYGFHEWEAPVLEATELYQKKSGAEITQQLFCFTDKGDREVSLRPELTPSLARMVSARQREYKKPIKWFQIGPCFRYEAPQKGRLREFIQWNCDLLGEASVEADAELIALGIDALRALGFTGEDFAVRVSDRRIWNLFIEQVGIDAERTTEFLGIIDKWEREKPEKLDERLQLLGTTRSAVQAFMEQVQADPAPFSELLGSLSARGMRDFVRIDPGIVRGLAYYTGVVFEFFALKEGMRAVAGGGRYDGLCALISDGSVDLPAVGFAMGDVVLANLIEATPAAKAARDAWLAQHAALDVYVVVADEAYRAAALGLLQDLRSAGLRADIALTAAKVGKQFQAAEHLKAKTAVVVGSEWPTVKVKHLARREEVAVDRAEVIEAVMRQQ